jgi:ribose 5-phosphate isomerase A
LDLTVDGADEIDARLRLVKGAGGALLREKIVAAASKRMVVVADESKFVARLGAAPLPIEIVPFGMEATRRAIGKALAGQGVKATLAARLGRDGTLFVTDEGHHILDARLSEIAEPEALASALAEIPGIVEHGLFLGLATQAILAGPQGLRILDAPANSAKS